VIKKVCENFESEVEAIFNKGYCSYPSFKKDFDKIVHQLKAENMFVTKKDCKLIGYNSHPLLGTINLTSWIKSKIVDLKVT